MTDQNGYQHLEFRKPDELGREGPYIRGTNIRARVVAVEFYSWHKKDYDAAANDRSLPIEAIREAVDWFDKNRDVAEKDAALERRVLKIK